MNLLTGASLLVLAKSIYYLYIAFSHDVTAAILAFQNNETAAILVFQTNPLGVGLFSYVKIFLFS